MSSTSRMTGDSGSESEHTPRKRRTLVACEACRLHKLACDGHRPCGRCCKRGRECISSDLQVRSRLTRERMSELESQMATVQQLWGVLCPQAPLSEVLERVKEAGIQAALEAFGPSASQGRPPVNETAPNAVPSRADTTRTANQANYPPTRPPSPRSLALVTSFVPPGRSAAVLEWQEKHSPQDELSAQSPGQLDGMGAIKSMSYHEHSGAGGYIGMSSGATLLHVIRRLAGEDVFSTFNPTSSLHSLDYLMKTSESNHNSLSPPSVTALSSRRLPPAAVTKPFVDSYFTYFHTLTPLVHEPTVRAQIAGAIPLGNNAGTRVLINMIFAPGAFDLLNGDGEGEDGFQYYEIARGILQQNLLGEGSITMVQGLAVMALYEQKRNKPNTAYVWFGLAIRMAMAMGAHTSIGSEGLSPLDREIRCRVWWSLVTLEVGYCNTFGRPSCLSTIAFASHPPLNIPDDDLTVSDEVSPSEVAHVTLYTALIIQARLAKRLFGFQERLSQSEPSPTVEQIKWCGDKFREDLLAFPPYMQASAEGPFKMARAIQTWRSRDCQAVLYRPVLLAAAWASGQTAQKEDVAVRDVVETCRQLALDNLHDIISFTATYADRHRGYEWYALYFAFQAALTILLSVVSEPDHLSALPWRTELTTTIQWMRQLKSVRRESTSYADIIERVLSVTRLPASFQSSNFSDQTLSRNIVTTDFGGFDFQGAFDFDRYLLEIWHDGANGFNV